MEKTKNNKLSILEIILIIINIILIIVYIPMRNKKAGAYTNNVTTYNDYIDLSGYKIAFNSTITCFGYDGNNGIYSINEFYIDEYPSDILYSFNYGRFDPIGGETYWIYTLYYEASQTAMGDNTIYMTWTVDYERYITIVSGYCDINFYNYLLSNATLTKIEQEEFYNISYNLQNVLIIGNKPTQISNLEEINLEIQNFNNYELPQNIMVENASYNWNYETGILTIYDATGNVSITIRAEYISGNYSFIELIDSVVLIPLNTFFNLFNFELFGVNIYALLTATLTLFVIIKILLKVFK